MNHSLLILVSLSDTNLQLLRDAFDVTYAPDQTAREKALSDHPERFDFVLTNGTTGIAAADVDRLPNVTFIAAQGAGYENLPLEHARARGIALANGTGTNAACVADHAFALLLAVVRDVPHLNTAIRDGAWRETLPILPNVSGKRMGIVGLGTIGAAIARRAAGFDMEVAYHNRKPRADSPLRYVDQLVALADWADYLMIATPGGEGTKHLIDAKVLQALGPKGFLVNIGRGSVVDTDALVAALHADTILGAALDVYEGEPHLPDALRDAPRLVLTPHVGGRSPEATRATITHFIENARRHFAGETLLTPV